MTCRKVLPDVVPSGLRTTILLSLTVQMPQVRRGLLLLPYKDVDVMKIFALNKVGAATNEKGEKIYFGNWLDFDSLFSGVCVI